MSTKELQIIAAELYKITNVYKSSFKQLPEIYKLLSINYKGYPIFINPLRPVYKLHQLKLPNN